MVLPMASTESGRPGLLPPTLFPSPIYWMQAVKLSKQNSTEIGSVASASLPHSLLGQPTSQRGDVTTVAVGTLLTGPAGSPGNDTARAAK